MGKEILNSARDIFKDYLSQEEIKATDMKVDFAVAITLFMLDKDLTDDEMANLMDVDKDVLDVLKEGSYEKLTVKGEDSNG